MQHLFGNHLLHPAQPVKQLNIPVLQSYSTYTKTTMVRFFQSGDDI